jgi:CubicO group peptidase (beta-lactamase class C family)
MLYADSGSPAEAKPVAFGHAGSDGTWAWAWPEHDLMVLYFTQSRGNRTGIALERAIERLLINTKPARNDLPDKPAPGYP